jgi:hypothetical protein
MNDISKQNLTDEAFTSRMANELIILLNSNKFSQSTMLISHLEEETLNKVKKLLSPKEMSYLNSALKKYPIDKSSKSRDQFDIHLKKVLIKDSTETPLEEAAICSSLTKDQIAEFIQINPKYSGGLMKRLTPFQLKSFIDELSGEDLENFLALPTNEPEDFNHIINSYLISKRDSLFQENLQQTITNLNFASEKFIYQKLKDEKKNTLVKELMMTKFPKFLIITLSEVVLKDLMKTESSDAMIEFLNAVDDADELQAWLDLSSEANTQRRELITSELKPKTGSKKKYEDYLAHILSKLNTPAHHEEKKYAIDTFINS